MNFLQFFPQLFQDPKKNSLDLAMGNCKNGQTLRRQPSPNGVERLRQEIFPLEDISKEEKPDQRPFIEIPAEAATAIGLLITARYFCYCAKRARSPARYGSQTGHQHGQVSSRKICMYSQNGWIFLLPLHNLGIFQLNGIQPSSLLFPEVLFRSAWEVV